MRASKTARIAFDRDGFLAISTPAREFQDEMIRDGCRTPGQTAFFLTYDDVGEIEVMNGLARWLGGRAPR